MYELHVKKEEVDAVLDVLNGMAEIVGSDPEDELDPDHVVSKLVGKFLDALSKGTVRLTWKEMQMLKLSLETYLENIRLSELHDQRELQRFFFSVKTYIKLANTLEINNDNFFRERKLGSKG